ncbi:MAG: dihydropteroate synthase [Gammaproteobacteria bacterium]|jgi:dihydropteroate synthase|nr:dihydropteroate synthase [Gammaproteobacteria bacterium]MBT7603323.1 dihydropteroate synthase [Gammaproteobacteria bacterium]
MKNKLDSSKPIIMGILNVTPDSFSDGGAYPSSELAVEKALIMIKQGANIIDIGGESTRPGSQRVSAIEQKRRIIDVISQLKKVIPSNIIISVDTTLSDVANAAINLGVDMINDVSGGIDDDKMFSLVAEHDVYYCIMHMKGPPKTMQDNPTYKDVISEVIDFLNLQSEKAIATGINKNKIIVDPGIGFGKTTAHNIEILKNLNRVSSMGYLSLLGTSRKKLFSEVSENNNPLDRVSGTCATSALGVMANINIFRVHDVWQNKQAIDVAFAIKNR